MDENQAHEMAVREFLAKPPFNMRNLSKEDVAVFSRAFTHDSFTNEQLPAPCVRNAPSNERLEFLGDAVVELIVCNRIFAATSEAEGGMTDLKQEAVANRKMSQRICTALPGFDDLMRVGHGHKDQKSKDNRIEDNMRADAFEALTAAVFLRFGLEEADRIVCEVLLKDVLGTSLDIQHN